MKYLKVLILSLSLLILTCERDDICAETTSTTSRLLIEFYDIASPEDIKTVSSLTAYGEGLVVDPIEESNAIVKMGSGENEVSIFNVNRRDLSLPLKIGNEGENTTTRFVLESRTDLRLNDQPTNTSNKDIIEISYTPEFQYVSRACGYRSVFTNLDVDLDITDDTNLWISSIEILVSTIENENTVHVQIFH